MSSDNTQRLAESVEENKSVLGQVWDAVVDGVQTAAHKAVETLQHGVEVAETVGLTVVDAALGAKDGVVEKTAEIVEAGKEKAALLSEQAAAKTTGIRHAAGEYIEAGKEKAAQLTHQVALKTEPVKEVIGEYIEAGKQKISSTISKKSSEDLSPGLSSGELYTSTHPRVDDTGLPSHGRTKNIPLSEAREHGKEFLAMTHGSEVDPTGHIAVAPPQKAGKESDYVGGWETVGQPMK